MFSRNADRPAPDDRRVVPNSPAATPQGVRDVSARSAPAPQREQTAAVPRTVGDRSRGR